MSRRSRGRFGQSCLWLLIATIPAWGATALAQQMASFALGGCQGVRPDAISRLLEIELKRELEIGTLPRSARPRIATTCGPTTTTIAVQDPVTAKNVMRSIPSPVPWGPASERVLAIATSELIIASWMELLVQDSGGSTDSPALRRARALIHRSLKRRIPRPPTPWAVGVAIGGRARQLAHPFGLVHARLRVARQIAQRWQLFVQGTVELGRASRATGNVDALLTGGSGGAQFSLPLWRQLALELEASLGALYVQLDGSPTQAGFEGTKANGAAGEATGAINVAWHADRLRAGVGFEVGATFPTISGEVEGDESVRLSGVWLGGIASVAFAF